MMTARKFNSRDARWVERIEMDVVYDAPDGTVGRYAMVLSQNEPEFDGVKKAILAAAEAMEKRLAAEEEARERAELKRLREKYGE